MIIATAAGLFGPYGQVEELADRIRVWPVGAPVGHVGADLPFEAIGAYEVLDITVPAGFEAAAYDWVDDQLKPKAPSPTEEVSQ
jgi:hypothetical protein